MKPNSRMPALVAALTLLGGAGGVATLHAAPQTRTFRQAFPLGQQEIRLANLAGRIEIVAGQGNQIVADATVHAEASGAGETQRLLQDMKWVKSHDRKGREEWALSYPVERYRSFVYPNPNRQDEHELPAFLSFLEGMGHSSSVYRGERVRIYSATRSSVPTLYVDLRISLPAGGNTYVRNVVGPVRAGNLEGTLGIDTGSGKVEVASHSGHLMIDTGSGDVIVGSVKGETAIDTGSGDVIVKRLVGNGAVDTGSGDVIVQQVSAGRLSIDTGSGDVTVQDGVAGKVIADTGSGSVKVIAVEVEELAAETGSGDVTVHSSLDQAKRISAETGSGDVEIHAGPNASFDIDSDQGSGDLNVGYSDAVLRKSGKKVVGAKRGDGRTRIHVETGSGDCTISPRG
jgi:putative adhesin